MFLYEKIDAVREYGNIAEVPKYIVENLNKNFVLREYQIKAFENFISYFENQISPRPLQVLFHMATGSGKTLIMAGLIIYLYKQGYRNFLFFVNLTNILDKTRENFLNAESAKYLFAQELNIDGEKININVVENFQAADENSINICFDTTQGLHLKTTFARENQITLEDFKDYKTVFISDEAHHLNAATKKGKVDDAEYTWQNTIEKIFRQNAENILLEFTATCDLANKDIKEKYTDKIIFDYPLTKFYNDKYSKEIRSLRSDFEKMDKALIALMLSQYRLKVFQENRLNIKPVVLLKSAKIDDSKNFMAEFLETIKNLRGEKLSELSAKCTLDIFQRAVKYFEHKEISYEMLADELREDFSEIHCISVNDDKAAAENQILLNSLEDTKNPYRAIFEVKKLDEGWDVLNLFDIVRLYETRQSGGKKISQVTISEAQLIGRGARYCPFRINNEQEKFKRKYDNDLADELRICEMLLYHCQNDSRYINELKAALKEIGLEMDRTACTYELKESFKQTDFYNKGVIFLNTRVEVAPPVFEGLPPAVREKIYTYEINAGNLGTENLLKETVAQVSTTETISITKTFKEIAEKNFALVNKALCKFPVYKFSNLKSIFENLQSTRNFIFDENFLGNIKIDIKSPSENLSNQNLYDAAFKALKEIADKIEKPQKSYAGTFEFYPQGVKGTFTNKTVHYSTTHEGGLGESQNKTSLDLSDKEWFAYTDNFGTSEEKAFVKYFSENFNSLKKVYDTIFLVRNERQCKIYSFDEGKRFEPDYVLFLQKKDAAPEYLQIFIEMKGDGYIAKDIWKEKFLLQLKETVKPIILTDGNKYKIWGFHFFNQENRRADFDADFNSLNFE